MSRRKQAAINAARIAKQRTISTNEENRGWQNLTTPKSVTVVVTVALLVVGVLGAAVSQASFGSNGVNGENSILSGWFGASPAAPATPAALAGGLPLPTPTPGARLSKEYVYAGGRMLAQEDAGSPASQSQPADLVVWRPSSGAWYVRDSGDGTTSTGLFGAESDQAVPADFDGDGLFDFCVFRPASGTWYILPSGGSGFYGLQFGLSDDVPAPADYDGDGKADIAVWRNSNNTFYLTNSSTNAFRQIPIGQNGDTPVAADYDGDGRADPATYRSSNGYWTARQSSDGQEKVQGWGVQSEGDMPVPGDYDGDGKTDLAIRRNNNQAGQWQWHISKSSDGQPMYILLQLGSQSEDISVQGDYDGDGKTDAAVWLPSNGTWYIRKSGTNQMRVDQWGQQGDTPVPAPMKR